ncbi:MAG: S1 RNA-binding domain-containing protein, partial [Flavobacterium sp.]
VHQDGLVHTSQLANRYVANPNDVVKVSEVVKVTVVDVDIARKRISLTMKTDEQPKERKPEHPKPRTDQPSKFDKPKPKSNTPAKDADGDLQEKLAKLKGMFK